MRDPLNLKEVEINSQESYIFKIENLPEFEGEEYDLFDPKDFKKYLDDIKRDVRKSVEYRRFINFLRENMDMNKCSFYENVTNIDTFKIAIEIHHEPLSLFDICNIVYNKRVFYQEDLSVEMVSKEVMYLHYCLLIGLIPLSATVHELVGNNYLFIPTNKVMGNYKDFIEMYNQFMTPEDLDILSRIEEFTNTYIDYLKGNNNHILDKSYMYTDTSSAYEFPKYEDILNMINNRIKEIKTPNTTNKPIKPIKFTNN